MQIPLSLYDFFGYALPGLIVIVLVTILIIAPLETDQQSMAELWREVIQTLIDPSTTDRDKTGSTSLPTTAIKLILYGTICYLVGFATHGGIYWFVGSLSKIWKPLRRYHSDHGYFEKGLFYKEYRDYPEDFGPYTDEFVRNLKAKIKDVFEIDVETARKEARDAKNDVKHTEVFDLCRTVVLKQSPNLYTRGFALLARYNSAKLMGAIFFFATFAFFIKFVGFWKGIIWIILLIVSVLSLIVRRGARLGLTYGLVTVSLTLIGWLYKESDPLFICYCISAVLCPVFFHLYHVLFRYYRNTILYGFYEYAVPREASEKSKQQEN